MTTPSSPSNAQAFKFALAKYAVFQAIAVPILLQSLAATAPIAQPKPTAPTVEQPAQALPQCRWSLLQTSKEQSTKIPATNWQALSAEIEALVAVTENPSRFAVQPRPIITNEEVWIGGGGDDPDSVMSDDCWKQL